MSALSRQDRLILLAETRWALRCSSWVSSVGNRGKRTASCCKSLDSDFGPSAESSIVQLKFVEDVGDDDDGGVRWVST